MECCAASDAHFHRRPPGRPRATTDAAAVPLARLWAFGLEPDVVFVYGARPCRCDCALEANRQRRRCTRGFGQNDSCRSRLRRAGHHGLLPDLRRLAYGCDGGHARVAPQVVAQSDRGLRVAHAPHRVSHARASNTSHGDQRHSRGFTSLERCRERRVAAAASRVVTLCRACAAAALASRSPCDSLDSAELFGLVAAHDARDPQRHAGARSR
eukprot:Amastigsp_a668_28.p2 type:complete len:212 gc:universal Amastigsp_a668_28:536-1171(+)